MKYGGESPQAGSQTRGFSIAHVLRQRWREKRQGKCENEKEPLGIQSGENKAQALPLQMDSSLNMKTRFTEVSIK